MFSLLVFFTAALPFCDGSTDREACAQWMANDMILEQYVNPGHELEWYTEGASERLPDFFWP